VLTRNAGAIRSDENPDESGPVKEFSVAAMTTLELEIDDVPSRRKCDPRLRKKKHQHIWLETAEQGG
jgi:hypothetical protein